MYNRQIARIDTISKIDLDTVTLPDICWRYGTGVSTATGNKRAGTYKSGYRNGIMTSLGDIERQVWRQVAEHIARRDGQVWLVEALTDWENAHNYANWSREDVYYSALYLYSNQMFDDPEWSHYIPFNRRYRADALKQAHFVTIVTSCCKKPGDVTREQIDHAYQGRIYCPHCDRGSDFFIVDIQEDPPWEES